MKTILSSRKQHYVAKVCIFLITVALIAGMIGCSINTGTPRYDLTTAVAPPGSGTAADLTNGSPYKGGTGVSIKAVAATGYQFVSWTAPAGTFANPNASETTFTMPGRDVTVTANFAAAGHNLVMAVNPVGGGTATDLSNASPYTAGTGVTIKAVAATGYQFGNWSAPAGTFANANAAQTTFTMPAQGVTVTANFEHEVLFSDDFSDEAGVWGTGSDEDGSVFYETGWLHVVDYTGGPSIITSAHQHFTDFILEVETKLVGGTDDNWHMVLCRYQDDANHYDFRISADGYYAIARFISGNGTALVEATQSSYINQGVDAVNLIHIECIGSNLSLSVNGHVLRTVTDTAISSGDIALGGQSLAGSSTEIAFDNITVTRP
jgi:uncharacterized repeat protein (TIGR02543 family)